MESPIKVNIRNIMNKQFYIKNYLTFRKAEMKVTKVNFFHKCINFKLFNFSIIFSEILVILVFLKFSQFFPKKTRAFWCILILKFTHFFNSKCKWGMTMEYKILRTTLWSILYSIDWGIDHILSAGYFLKL